MPKTIAIQNPVMLTPKLLVVQGGNMTIMELKETKVIGRATVNNHVDIDLPMGFVSRRHGELGCDALGWYYIDTNSTAGTYLGNTKVIPGKRNALRDGDVLRICNVSTESAEDIAVIVFLTNYPPAFTKGRIPLTDTAGEISIGRSPAEKLSFGEQSISAHHASFFLADAGWAVVDHGSTNGVFINNRRITHPEYLHIGDCVRIASLCFVYAGDCFLYQAVPAPKQVPPAAGVVPGRNPARQFPDEPLSIHIIERSVSSREGRKILLQNIDLTVQSGEMVLILGGSGAGKTTFMNAVMGYEKANGSIRHGKKDLYADFQEMKHQIGFVPQQDLLRGSDSVFYTLENAAMMKLPRRMKKPERLSRIDLVLKTLGLSAERDTLVSKLSGGQRKRLSVAVEYISDPSLFFLDEPDSGLDGIMARALMENLRTIADEGKIVMVISHAPDRVPELFDKVIVLAKSTGDLSGHLAFYGSVPEAKAFFGTQTLEDVVRRINRPEEGGEGLADHYIARYQAERGNYGRR